MYTFTIKKNNKNQKNLKSLLKKQKINTVCTKFLLEFIPLVLLYDGFFNIFICTK